MADAQHFEQLLNQVSQGKKVRTHSGEVRPGDVFVALQPVEGTVNAGVDGATFIPDALQHGAEVVVAVNGQEQGAAAYPVNEAEQDKLLLHPDPRKALGELAGAYFGTRDLLFPMVGITGTNGKTTVTYLLEHLLREVGNKTGVLGTVEYRWPGYKENASLTTPGCWKLHEMLAQMKEAGTEVAVMEASSHALIQQRTAGVRFKVGVLTNVTQDHLDYHGDMESYFNAKALLFKAEPGHEVLGVFNWDDPYGRRLLTSHRPAVGYGFGILDPAIEKDVDTVAGEIVSSTVSGLKLKINSGGKEWLLESPLVGEFNAWNLLSVVAAARALGVPEEEMEVLSTFTGVPGRMERVPNKRSKNIFVDYAHTPDALENVLRSIRKLDFDRLITVFGCGGDRDRTKRPLMAEAVARYSDVAVLTSDNPRHESPLAIMDDTRPGLRDCPMVLETPDRKRAFTVALEEMRRNDVLIVAGKGHETYQQIGDTKYPFSDREVIMELLS